MPNEAPAAKRILEVIGHKVSNPRSDSGISLRRKVHLLIFGQAYSVLWMFKTCLQHTHCHETQVLHAKTIKRTFFVPKTPQTARLLGAPSPSLWMTKSRTKRVGWMFGWSGPQNTYQYCSGVMQHQQHCYSIFIQYPLHHHHGVSTGQEAHSWKRLMVTFCHLFFFNHGDFAAAGPKASRNHAPSDNAVVKLKIEVRHDVLTMASCVLPTGCI